MPKYGSQIDTQRIPVKGLVAEGGTVFPASPVEGQMFHRTDLKQYFIYLNAAWTRCDNQGVAAAAHIHAIADVTGLQSALDSKTIVYGTTAGTAMQGNTRLDQIAVPQADMNINGKRLTNVAEPVAASDAATKGYVDLAIQGLDGKQEVQVATTGPISLTAPGNTMDGVIFATGDRVLVKDQADNAENGIYVKQADGSLVRADDASTWLELQGAYVFVDGGLTHNKQGWLQSIDNRDQSASPIYIWAKFSAAGELLAGGGITIVNNRVSVDPGVGLSISQDGVEIDSEYRNRRYKASVPALTAGAWTNITHYLGSAHLDVTFNEASSGENVILDWKRVSADVVAVRSDVAYAANSLYVFILAAVG